MTIVGTNFGPNTYGPSNYVTVRTAEARTLCEKAISCDTVVSVSTAPSHTTLTCQYLGSLKKKIKIQFVSSIRIDCNYRYSHQLCHLLY